jgi:hypothetical protein
MPDSLPPAVSSALTAAKRLARSLDNIRAVDYRFAYEDGKRTDRPSIRFHMNRKQRLSRLSAGEADFFRDVRERGHRPAMAGSSKVLRPRYGRPRNQILPCRLLPLDVQISSPKEVHKIQDSACKILQRPRRRRRLDLRQAAVH